MEVNIGISNNAPICDVLCRLLADEHVLSLKTHGAHWNIKGIDFAAAHAFYGGQHDEIEGFIDDVAERIQQLGCTAPATMSEYLRMSRLSEAVNGNTSRVYYLALALDHEAIIRALRLDIPKIDKQWGDCGTANFLTDLMEKHEKMAWMLRSHI